MKRLGQSLNRSAVSSWRGDFGSFPSHPFTAQTEEGRRLNRLWTWKTEGQAMKHVLATGVCHNPRQKEPSGISIDTFFQAFMFSARPFPGLDHSELQTEEKTLLPFLTVCLGSQLDCVAQCQTKPRGSHFQPHKWEMRITFCSVCVNIKRFKAGAHVTIWKEWVVVYSGLSAPFSTFFCWFGVEALWRRMFTVLLAVLKWGCRRINNRKQMLLKRTPGPVSKPTFK